MNRRQLILDLMVARGAIRTLEVRAKVTKDLDKRKDYQTRLEEAYKLRDSAHAGLKMLN